MSQLDGTYYIVYQAVMLYGMFSLISNFLWRQTRGVSEYLWLVLGVAVPIGAWMFSTFAAESLMVLPAALAILAVIIKGREIKEGFAQRRMWAAELREAEDLLRRDPGNATGYWAKAKLYEAQGRYGAALKLYEKAHSMSTRTVSPHEMDEARDRLGLLISQSRWGWVNWPWRLLKRMLSIEALLFFVGLGFTAWDGAAAANICSLMLFCFWLKGKAAHS